MKDALGDRMKKYEKCYSIQLPTKMPIIVRVDGKAFHTLTRGMKKPFDDELILLMQKVAMQLVNEVDNCKLAYVQSDEISFLLDDRATDETSAYFDNKLQKISSVIAGLSTKFFIKESMTVCNKYLFASFDARAFIVPESDIPNYFLWRQKDWMRNSLSMYARSFYSSKELQSKNRDNQKTMIKLKGGDWDSLEDVYKFGTFIKSDYEIIHKQIDYESFKEVL